MTTNSTRSLTDLIREYTEAVWNNHDVGAMDRYYSPAYVHHDVSRPDVSTLEDYRQWARDLLAAFSNLHVAAEDVIADTEAGKALKRWTATGEHTGGLAGIAPTGRRVSFSGMSVYRIEGGRIIESWYVYDLFGLLQQINA